MRSVITIVYVVMVAYLLLSSAIRLALQLSSGQRLDPLPFVGGVLGLAALALLLRPYLAWRRSRGVSEDR